MLKAIKGVTPGVILLNVFILLALWFSAFLFQGQQSVFSDHRSMPLYFILRNLTGPGQIEIIISLAFILLISYLLVHYNTILFFIPERTIVPSVLYAIFTGFFINYQTLHPVIPASVFMLIALRRIIDVYHVNETAFSFFDASLLIGVGSLFYANLIWFGIIPLIGVIILKGYKLKEMMLSIAGIPVTLLITAGIYYLFSPGISGLIENLRFNLFSEVDSYNFSIVELAGIATGGITLLAGIIFVFKRIKNMKIKSRKIFILLLWWCLISVALYFISPAVSVEISYLAAIPSVYYISYYFIFSKSRIIPLAIFIAFIVCASVIQALRYF